MLPSRQLLAFPPASLPLCPASCACPAPWQAAGSRPGPAREAPHRPLSRGCQPWVPAACSGGARAACMALCRSPGQAPRSTDQARGDHPVECKVLTVQPHTCAAEQLAREWAGPARRPYMRMAARCGGLQAPTLPGTRRQAQARLAVTNIAGARGQVMLQGLVDRRRRSGAQGGGGHARWERGVAGAPRRRNSRRPHCAGAAAGFPVASFPSYAPSPGVSGLHPTASSGFLLLAACVSRAPELRAHCKGQRCAAYSGGM